MNAAADQFAKVLATQPSHPDALNNLAWLLAQQRSPRALELARRALVLQPRNPGYLDTLATALSLQGKLPEALEAQKQAVEIAPSDPALRLRLAKLAKDSGDTALARRELEKVLAAPLDRAISDEAAILIKDLK
jgi:tetratricopeptide (TPR) repeat protein